jgi:HAD superfamily hydrolase (TIGR01549 family)
MVVTTVVFDVGETLVDETRAWERIADVYGVPRFTLVALIGAAIERGESHRRAFEWLGIDGPFGGFSADQLYPDAVPCLRTLRKRGMLVGAVANMQALNEDVVRPYVDFVGSSERWGVEKPSPEFFERVVAEAERPVGEIAYVGDRVDNDVLPAKRAGMLAVHVRRGPWGILHDASEADVRIESLDELAEALFRRRLDGAGPGAEAAALPAPERE